jgi:hypothetical protein
VSPTTKHQQLILLDHDKAKGLDTLAKQENLPKQVLLREAVDILLTIYGAPVVAITPIHRARDQLKYCEHLLGRVWRGKQEPEDLQRACAEVLVRVKATLEELGSRKKRK